MKENSKLTVSFLLSVTREKMAQMHPLPPGSPIKVMCKAGVTPRSPPAQAGFHLNLESAHLGNVRGRREKNVLEGGAQRGGKQGVLQGEDGGAGVG